MVTTFLEIRRLGSLIGATIGCFKAAGQRQADILDGVFFSCHVAVVLRDWLRTPEIAPWPSRLSRGWGEGVGDQGLHYGMEGLFVGGAFFERPVVHRQLAVGGGSPLADGAGMLNL